MKNKIIITIIVVILIVAVSIGQKDDNEVIKLGFTAPLTGNFPDWGEALMRGALLAVEDTENKFVLDIQDSACDPSKVVSAGRKFFDVNNINIVIGPGCLGGLKSLMPIAVEKNAILFSTGLLDEEVLDMHDSSLVNFATQISMEAEYISAFWSDKDIESVAILHDIDAFGVEFRNQFSKYISQSDIVVSHVESVPTDESDLRTTATKFIESNPDLIVLNAGEKQMGIFAKLLQELGYTNKVHAIYTAESDSFIEAAGDSANGITYTFPLNVNEETIDRQNFDRKFKERYGEDSLANANTYFVYDGIMILDEIVSNCGPKNTDCIEQSFKTYGKYSGLSGEFEFRSDGGNIRPFGIKKIEEGEFVWIEKDISLK